jgi:phosphoribosylglycinamide formyltransferase-1
VKLGLLASGRGSNVVALLEVWKAGRLGGAEPVVVIANVAGAPVLERAAALGVPTRTVPHRAFPSRDAFEAELVKTLRDHGAEWVALAGFMRLLGGGFLGAFPGKVVNIHPSLLPAFPGIHAQRQALEYGVKVSGCTIHFVDEGVDTGAIIAQATVPVHDDDDESALAARILHEEHRLYAEVVRAIAEGRVTRDGRRVRVTRT